MPNRGRPDPLFRDLIEAIGVGPDPMFGRRLQRLRWNGRGRARAICSRRQPNRSSTQCRGERGSRPSFLSFASRKHPASAAIIDAHDSSMVRSMRRGDQNGVNTQWPLKANRNSRRRRRPPATFSEQVEFVGRATRWEFSLRSSAFRTKPIWLACHHWSGTTRYGPVQPDQGHDTGYPSAETGDQRETTHRHGRYSRRKASRGSRRAARRAGR
jgi:hypothetical protein